MSIFGLYVLVFLLLAWVDRHRAGTTEGFFLNHRASGTTEVTFSILASCVGGSATVGLCGLAFTAGLPAAWWLVSGAIGLVVLTTCLARKVRESRALTMPELLRARLGDAAYRAVTLVILTAWTGILAAQLVAMGKIIAALTALDFSSALLTGTVFIALYTMIGGQASVMKSDVLQCLMMLGGLLTVAAVTVSSDARPLATLEFDLLNDAFPLSQWSAFMLFVGGSYVVCPMLFARVMSARSVAVARRAGFLAAAGLVLTALVIVAIGVEARAFVPADTPADNVLTALVETLPAPVRLLFLVAMLSTILSSADSCLVTAATVASHDLLGTSSLRVTRAAVGLFALLALLLAAAGQSILGLLLMANAVYVCAVVPPAFAALVSTRPFVRTRLLVTILGGALLTLAGEAFANPILGYLALAWSVAGSVLSLDADAAPRADPQCHHRVEGSLTGSPSHTATHQ